MAKQYVKFGIILLVLFSSIDILAQTSTSRQVEITPTLLEGTWIVHHVDSTFGHKSSLEFSFTKTGSFTHEYKLDGKIKEKYAGEFKISNTNILILKIAKKPAVSFKVIQLSIDFLKLKEIGAKDIISLTRK